MMRGLLAENGIEVAVAASGGPDLRSLYGAGDAASCSCCRPISTRLARSSPATSRSWSARRRRLRPHGGALRRAATRRRRVVGAVRADGDGRARRRDAAARRRLWHRAASRNAAAERFGVRAWGVDSSQAMVEQARARGARGSPSGVASADALPFRDGWFDAVTMRLVVHTLGRRAPERLPRGGARARARAAASSCGRSRRSTSPASTSRRTCRACRPSISRASPSPTCSRTSCAARASATVEQHARCSRSGSSGGPRRAARVRGRLHLDRAPAARGRGRRRRWPASRPRRPRARPICRRVLDWRLLVASADAARA